MQTKAVDNDENERAASRTRKPYTAPRVKSESVERITQNLASGPSDGPGGVISGG